ncbi:MAG: sodium:calcium antiporter [Oscillochloris sp.]|nr:sodium:calcium antiporter [Oscillochloris sp.]
MLDMSNWPLVATIGVFVAAAIVIAVAGSRLAMLADRLADRTGMGEAIAGAVFLGASTSLSGVITSVTAAAGGLPQLAVSNAVGGIAVQAAFLAVADIYYRQSTLEHAAASPAAILQGAMLVTLLALPIIATTSRNVSFWGIHPATPLLFVAYGYGLRLLARARTEPMWRAEQTPQTQNQDDQDEDEDGKAQSTTRMWLLFALNAGLVGVAGYVIARSAGAIVAQTGLTQSAVGTVFTAASTSLAELVTLLAAVRRGALTLAVSDIVGGNSFDVLFIAVSDIAFRPGSIYHELNDQQIFWMGVTILLNGILLMGLIRRDRRQIITAGPESWLVILLYAGAVGLLFFGGG